MTECPAGTEKTGDQCVALVNLNCAAGLHFVDGLGCVANVVSQPAQPAQPASVPLSTTKAPGKMVMIPAGTFSMGSTAGDNDEKPVHSVRVASFEMDATEVTVGAYRQCMSAGGCSAPGTDQYCNWGRSGKDDHPINCVDWTQAKTFCEWAGKRLPTEEEWEYAARGTDGRTYPWGNEEPWGRLCWSRRHDPSAEGTCAVRSYPAGDSPFGISDMAGNVWEWTSSGYSDRYDKNRSKSAFVNRGGSWFSDTGRSVRAAFRFRFTPMRRSGDLGFRCAR